MGALSALHRACMLATTLPQLCSCLWASLHVKRSSGQQGVQSVNAPALRKPVVSSAEAPMTSCAVVLVPKEAAMPMATYSRCTMS